MVRCITTFFDGSGRDDAHDRSMIHRACVVLLRSSLLRERCGRGCACGVPAERRRDVFEKGVNPFSSPSCFFRCEPDCDHAVEVVSNWRGSHAYPEQVMCMTLVRRTEGIGRNRRSRSKALVTQRRKRFESIWRKTRLNPRMDLTRCRTLVGAVQPCSPWPEVRQLINAYEHGISVANTGSRSAASDTTTLKDPLGRKLRATEACP